MHIIPCELIILLFFAKTRVFGQTLGTRVFLCADACMRMAIKWWARKEPQPIGLCCSIFLKPITVVFRSCQHVKQLSDVLTLPRAHTRHWWDWVKQNCRAGLPDHVNVLHKVEWQRWVQRSEQMIGPTEQLNKIFRDCKRCCWSLIPIN